MRFFLKRKAAYVDEPDSNGLTPLDYLKQYPFSPPAFIQQVEKIFEGGKTRASNGS